MLKLSGTAGFTIVAVVSLEAADLVVDVVVDAVDILDAFAAAARLFAVVRLIVVAAATELSNIFRSNIIIPSCIYC